MSTPVKVGLVVVLIAAVVGSGYLGTRAAAAQRAAVAVSAPQPAGPNAQPTTPPEAQSPARPQQPGAPGFAQPNRPGFQGPFGPGNRGPMMPGFRGQDSRGLRGPDGRGFREGMGRGFLPGPRGFDYGGRRGNIPSVISGGWAGQYRSQINSAVAGALGVSIEEYDKAIAEGQSPWQIAQGKGISAADFQSKMVDAMSVVLKQAVADGRLTQSQADALIARMKQGGIPAAGFGVRPGRGGGPWGHPRP